MNILVTGGFGYIGNEVIERLCNKHNITVCDNSKWAAERFFPLWQGKINYIQQDINELKSASDIDFIIHMAAEVGYVACDKNEKLAYHTNVEGTKKIMSFNVPTIFFSTSSVYGSVPFGTICNEDTPRNPQTIYSKTKLLGENIISSIDEKCIIRPATIYGISKKTRHDLLLHTFIKLAIHKKKFDVYQPDAIRTMYHVQKIADFICHCVENWDNYKNKILNIGSKNTILTKKQMLDKISKYLDFEVNYIEGKDKDCRDYEVDYSKLKSIWQENEDNIDLHLKNIIDYYRYCDDRI